MENGTPIYKGQVELLDEYLDRVETLRIGQSAEIEKKVGPLGPRLYNGLRDAAYLAVRSEGLKKEELATRGGDSTAESAAGEHQTHGADPCW